MRRTPTSLPQLLAAATSWDSPTPHALLRKRLGRPWPSSLRCTHPSPPTCSFVPRVSVQFPLRAPVSAMSVHSTSPCTRDLATLRAPPCTRPSMLWPPTTTTYLPVGLSVLCPCPCTGLSAVYPLTVRALAARSSSRTSAMLRACPCSAGPSCPPTCGPVRCLPPVPARAAPGSPRGPPPTCCRTCPPRAGRDREARHLRPAPRPPRRRAQGDGRRRDQGPRLLHRQDGDR